MARATTKITPERVKLFRLGWRVRNAGAFIRSDRTCTRFIKQTGGIQSQASDRPLPWTSRCDLRSAGLRPAVSQASGLKGLDSPWVQISVEQHADWKSAIRQTRSRRSALRLRADPAQEDKHAPTIRTIPPRPPPNRRVTTRRVEPGPSVADPGAVKRI